MTRETAELDGPQVLRLYRLLSEIGECDSGNDDPRLEEAADILAGLAEQAYDSAEVASCQAAYEDLPFDLLDAFALESDPILSSHLAHPDSLRSSWSVCLRVMPIPCALGYGAAVVDPELFRTLRDWIPCRLYHELGPVVAEDPQLLAIAGQGRPGQMPVTLLFSAVHYLLLAGTPHELRDFYPSVVGSVARPPTGAGPVFVDFVRRHRAEVEAVVRVRLVQRHVVLRAALLRLGMSWIGRETDGPVHLVEVGASAGALLRFDRYRYEIGGQVFGDRTSAVTISPQWKDDRVPDLDAVPPVGSAVGIDLHPVDPSDPDERRWLHALVWPDDQAEHLLLDAALAELVADPPRLRQGDAIDLCPIIADQLPAGEPRVAFHAATRMHVPRQRQPTFDAALATLGRAGPFYHLFLEPPEHGQAQGLVLRSPRYPGGVTLTQADGYGRWIGPLTPAI